MLQAQTDNKRPSDEFIAHVFDVLRGDTKDPDVVRAVELFHIPFKRDTLTAFLISKATPSQIERGTEILAAVFTIFEKLYVDPDQFQDKMDIFMYAHYYRDNICQKENRMQIEKAITDGPYALLEYWSMGNEVVRVTDEDITAKLMGIALRKLSAAAQASLISVESKEGLRWASLLEKVVNTRNRLNPTPTDAEELMLDLETDVVTEPIGEAFIGFDLSHLAN